MNADGHDNRMIQNARLLYKRRRKVLGYASAMLGLLLIGASVDALIAVFQRSARSVPIDVLAVLLRVFNGGIVLPVLFALVMKHAAVRCLVSDVTSVPTKGLAEIPNRSATSLGAIGIAVGARWLLGLFGLLVGFIGIAITSLFRNSGGAVLILGLMVLMLVLTVFLFWVLFSTLALAPTIASLHPKARSAMDAVKLAMQAGLWKDARAFFFYLVVLLAASAPLVPRLIIRPDGGAPLVGLLGLLTIVALVLLSFPTLIVGLASLALEAILRTDGLPDAAESPAVPRIDSAPESSADHGAPA
jgi:hypothetical protein